MNFYLPLSMVLVLTACAAAPPPGPDVPTQDRLAQPGPASAPGYWDALDNVPGARTGESDFYYAHRGGGRP